MAESWSKPSQADVETLLASIADLSLRSLFFGELREPRVVGAAREPWRL
jgi:hypothetical protein